MKKLRYADVVNVRGRLLSVINPGSDEVAFGVDDAIMVIELLADCKIIILGGDVLTDDTNGNLSYVVHEWGYEYVFLSWSCDSVAGESFSSYLQRSVSMAIEKVMKISGFAKNKNALCYIVFVTSGLNDCLGS
jgi:hypothetical protein